MALTRFRVFGNAPLPNGEYVPGSTIVFTLTGNGIDGANVLYPERVSVPLAAGGAFSVMLWPNARYAYETRYNVTVFVPSRAGCGLNGYDLGEVRVPSRDVDIGEILPVQEVRGRELRHVTKQGDTLAFGAVLVDRFMFPIDLTGDTITATMRLPGGVTSDFEVTVDLDPATGRVMLSMPATQTEVLPLGSHPYDIRRERAGAVKRTPTAHITIIEGITE